jgi:hypothetical protein
MEYEVLIIENISHTLEVSADSEDEALTKAYELLSNKPEDYLYQHHNYSPDGEYTGYHEIYEIEESANNATN